GSASAGDEIALIGINAAGDWYKMEAKSGDSAWIFAALVTVADAEGLAALPIMDGTTGDVYLHPMQAFYFRSGMGQNECHAVPDTLIIQNSGDHPVNLQINDLNLVINSTILFTSTTLDDGTVVLVGTLIEGTVEAYYEAFTLQLTQPGQSFAVTLNADGLVDENSELVDITGNLDIENDVAAGCQALAGNPVWGDNIPPCEGLTITYSFPEPEPPPDGDLSDIPDDAACTIVALNTANLRSGPGTNYPWNGQLAQNERENPTGYAIGTDGLSWWKLSNNLWIRSDLVNQAGACNSIPSVQPPAPPPISAPPSGGRTYEISQTCADMNNIRAGQTVTFQVGIGRWESPEATNAALAGHSARLNAFARL
ncbi:MAG: hypothetical protein KC496_15245, partial [Anaerolineae bacterium]|nr:hypothetical protein [Anaerolineae bacterium]